METNQTDKGRARVSVSRGQWRVYAGNYLINCLILNCLIMPVWHYLFSPMPMLEPLRNIDALSNMYTDNMYEYAPRPTCTKHSDECQSEFLFCDTQTNRQPKCSAKVKLGGNCSGFEWSDEVCYKGHCSQGRCIEPKKNADEVHEKRPKHLHKLKYM
jgi:hypothetical protein